MFKWFLSRLSWRKLPGPSVSEIRREVERCGVAPAGLTRKGDIIEGTFSFTVQENIRRTDTIYLDARGAGLRLLRKGYKAARAESLRLQERYNAGLKEDQR